MELIRENIYACGKNGERLYIDSKPVFAYGESKEKETITINRQDIETFISCCEGCSLEEIGLIVSNVSKDKYLLVATDMETTIIKSNEEFGEELLHKDIITINTDLLKFLLNHFNGNILINVDYKIDNVLLCFEENIIFETKKKVSTLMTFLEYFKDSIISNFKFNRNISTFLDLVKTDYVKVKLGNEVTLYPCEYKFLNNARIRIETEEIKTDIRTASESDFVIKNKILKFFINNLYKENDFFLIGNGILYDKNNLLIITKGE